MWKKWKPPHGSSFKVNVNVAVKGRNDGTSLGVVVRDASGNVNDASKKFFNASYSVVVVESVAIKEDLVLGAQLQLPELTIESDCITAVSLISRKDDICSDPDGVLTDTPSVSFNTIRMWYGTEVKENYNLVEKSKKSK